MPKAEAIDSDLFRAESRRRLVDSYDLMLGLGLRNKQSIWDRVARGKLPPPIINKPSIVALWDRDEVLAMTGVEIDPTDRKED